MRYKACCDKRCLNSHCEVREAGGCYCICRLVDCIRDLERAVDGELVCCGTVYCPEQKDRDEWFNRQSEEAQKIELNFRINVAPERLKDLKAQLARMTINED